MVVCGTTLSYMWYKTYLLCVLNQGYTDVWCNTCEPCQKPLRFLTCLILNLFLFITTSETFRRCQIFCTPTFSLWLHMRSSPRWRSLELEHLGCGVHQPYYFLSWEDSMPEALITEGLVGHSYGWFGLSSVKNGPTVGMSTLGASAWFSPLRAPWPPHNWTSDTMTQVSSRRDISWKGHR